MRKRAAAWLTELRDVGRAFLDVLAAEWTALTTDLGHSTRLLTKGVILLVVAAGLLGWATILLSLALVAFLESYLEPWLAALAVAALILLIAALVLAWAMSLLKGATPPRKLVQAHVKGHLDWIGEQLDATAETKDADAGEESADA